MNRPAIEALITKHEGRRNHVYLDTAGNPTIGIGFNLNGSEAPDICEHFGIDITDLKHGTVDLTDSQIDQIFDYQLTSAISDANSLLPNFPQMPDNFQQ